MNSREKQSELRLALTEQKPLLYRTLLFSFFVNLLVMAPTVYMLEVYDRVVNSGSGMTLAMLTLLVMFAYAVMEVLEWVRTGVLHDAALRFDARVSQRVFNTVFEARLRSIPAGSTPVLGDLRTVREFVFSPALLALIDVPFALLYILIIFAINPVMGWVSVVSACLLATLAWLTERDTQPALAAAGRAASAAQAYARNSLRNAQVIEAMGMHAGIHRRWLERQNEFLTLQAGASDRAGTYSSISRFTQLAQASLMLGLGAWLTIRGVFPGSGALIVVASTLGGRALAPIVQLIATWRQVVAARAAYARLDSLFESVQLRAPGMPLPAPRGLLSVEGVTASAPGSSVAILRGVTFSVAPGKLMAVIGPAAAGKSTLARLLVGIWPAASGKIRLDGVDIFPWNKAELGPNVGYLPQDVELFEGTFAENIARFNEVDMAAVEAAARAVGVHQLIAALPQGYHSQIGDDGCFLSGGQRQRIGLARAIYGNPRFIVLDEPNSSLDAEGEQALLQTMLSLKTQGTTIVVITHRTSILAAVDLMLVLHDGVVKACGSRDDVLAALQQGGQKPALANAK